MKNLAYTLTMQNTSVANCAWFLGGFISLYTFTYLSYIKVP